MSSQRGNVNRTRPQKHNNQFAFKNNLHDKSHITKKINEIEIANVCEKCKNKLEWRIKFKKYKILSAPSKCTKCQQKNVKHSYHIMCEACSKENDCCPKCGVKGLLVQAKNASREEQLKVDQEMQKLLKSLPERKRRTFLRYVERKDKNEQKDGAEKEDVINDLKKLIIKNKGEDFDDFDDLDEDISDEDQ